MRFSHFFIRRPIFAAVLSIFITLVGLLALLELPVASFPEVAPPTIFVRARFPGASPETVAATVATPLEQEINGVENMLYMSSASSADGSLVIQVTFKVGTDIDLAQVHVQNRVALALPRLPEEVRRLGIEVRKRSPSLTAVVTLFSPDGSLDDVFISNYAYLQVKDVLARLPGVGDVMVFAARDYSMRLWLDPDKLSARGLTVGDVVAAVREQNVEVAGGVFGQPPAPSDTQLQLVALVRGRLATEEEFGNIVLRTGPDGQLTRLRDVARVELGARDYSVNAWLDGKPAIAIGIFQQPGSNTIETADAVRRAMEELRRRFPAGLDYRIVRDDSLYIRASIREVIKTLLEAMVLVTGVVILFLQTWRASVIPLIAVPVSLIGTFAAMAALGFSINNLTLFGLVLAIGIVVDDAIVVLENVERHMRQEHVDAREATRRAMAEVSRPVIAIVLVLNAVFLPVAFLGGLVGEMYRQFAITIAVSVSISGFVALTLTPALCALFLKPGHIEPRGPLAYFDRWFQALTRRYTSGVGWVLRRSVLASVVIAAMLLATWGLTRAVPTALAPDEDQGYVISIAALPPAASLQRTSAVLDQLDQVAFAHPAYDDNFTLSGLDILTFSQRSNAGVSFVILKDWEERREPELSAQAVSAAFMGAGMRIRDGFVFSVTPPPIEGLSQTGGFEGFVQARTGNDYAALEAATQRLVAAANQRPELVGVSTSFAAQVPRVKVEVDLEKAKLLGVSMDDINTTLQSTFGAFYVNDFNRDGRVYRVHVQSESEFRAHPEDLRDVYVRSSNGTMLPLTAVATVVESTGPDVIERFNVFPAARISGNPAPGYSSGQALALMEELAAQHLPDGYTLAWSGQSYQEKVSSQNTAGLFGLAVLMVFLILAAQYERLTLPFAVILAVPFAVFGAYLAVWLRGLYDDLYLQIGLVTLVGLAAKNAILIVEFASHMHREGKSLRDAAVEAARLRFRPIVMTSLAFILGVVPLAISTGAGAASRHSIGTGVIGGMLAATFIAVLFIPLFYVWMERAGEWILRRRGSAQGGAGAQ